MKLTIFHAKAAGSCTNSNCPEVSTFTEISVDSEIDALVKVEKFQAAGFFKTGSGDELVFVPWRMVTAFRIR